MATALIADPSAAARRSAQSLLESLGFDVAGACDGGEVLSMIRAGEPDLVIVDSRVADFDGAALVEAIRALPGDRRPCIFFVTDNGGPASVRAALEAGADDYLVKPYDRELLSFRLVQAHARKRLDQPPTPAKLVQDNALSLSNERLYARSFSPLQTLR